MMARLERRTATSADETSSLAVICCGGMLPYAVAAAAAAQGRRVVLFPLRGWADPGAVTDYPHHWIALGQFGRFAKLAKAEGCRDIVLIGTIVRPAISQVRLDFPTVKILPRLITGFRGGDDHLLRAIGSIFEEGGFRLLGAQEVAPDVLVPEGAVGRRRPNARDDADIARGLAVLSATSPFDIGQAVVVVEGRVLALEAAEGTDQMLQRVADLRRIGRISSAATSGVLVKAPKLGQDRRFDLPSIGPQTVENVICAGLGGIAVAAGETIAAEPTKMAELADRGGIFIVGVRKDGTFA